MTTLVSLLILDETNLATKAKTVGSYLKTILDIYFARRACVGQLYYNQQLKFLKDRINISPFTKEDLQLLSTITNQIMVVFDRISKERALQALNESLESKVEDQLKEDFVIHPKQLALSHID